MDSPKTPHPRANAAPGPMSRWLHDVIFEADTRGGKAFDIILLMLILASVAVVMLETVEPFATQHDRALVIAEWTLTILFTIEYVLRLIAVQKPMAYARSFYGIIDLLAAAPTWLSFLLGIHAPPLMLLRAFRLLRVFRIFKLARYLRELQTLRRAFAQSQARLVVFLFAVLIIVVVMGAAMHLAEHDSNPKFSSIPQGVYWAVVTLTTVGYGDVTPVTPLGKVIAILIMVVGYSLILVPISVLSAELVQAKSLTTQACPHCMREGHEADAVHCKYCGASL